MDRKIVEMLLEGKSQRDVMRALRVGDRRTRKIISMAKQYGYLEKRTPLPAYPEALFPDGPDGRESKSSEADHLLLAKKDWITERLQGGWHPITVYEECGLSIGRSSFYRFLHRHDLYGVGMSRRRVVPEIIHNPGEALILDWGKLRDVVDPETGKKRTLWAFVGVLGFSRFMMVRLVWSNDTATTLSAIESMFQEMGGITYKITSDNPKCFALEASRYEPLLNPAFERFAGYYGTKIECLPPAAPEKKGKVERLMPFVRRLYEAHGIAWCGLEESQSYLNRKVGIANERIHGTTRLKPIAEFLDFEVSALKPLPAISYEREEISEGTVRRDGHVRFLNKYYSLDEKFINKEVLILGNSSQVCIYCEGKLIETHAKITNPNQSKSTKPHHLKPWERALNDGSIYRTRALTIGIYVEKVVLFHLEQGQGFIDTRKIWGILSLDKKYSSSVINEACRQAIELRSLSYRTIKSLCKLSPTSKLNSNENEMKNGRKTQESHKFVRPFSVYEEQLKLLN